MKNKFVFLKESESILEQIFDSLNNSQSVFINSLDKEKTVLVIIDMVNGFAKKGALHSPRIEGLIPVITRLSYKCEDLDIKKIAFADNHSEESPEFKSYPPHCLKETEESEIVSEIRSIGGYELIKKNSTNGFIEPAFQKWLEHNQDVNTFIVVGDCTDICISQFALTLKTHFNRLNKKSRIIVPMNAVNTYDLGMHNADLMQYISLYIMSNNDIEVVKQIMV